MARRQVASRCSLPPHSKALRPKTDGTLSLFNSATLQLDAPGTYCGEGGGQPGTFEATLFRQ